MPKGQRTEKCPRCRRSHLKCDRDPPNQAQCNNCKEIGVDSCTNEFPPPKQRKSNQVSRSPTQHHAPRRQRPLTRSRSSSRRGIEIDTIEAVPEPGAADGSSSFEADGNWCGATFEHEKGLEKCCEWLKLDEYLRAIAKSPGKLELDGQKESPGTKARSKVSNNILNPIYAILRFEIESGSDGAWQAERFLLRLQLAIAQFQRGTPADESTSLLKLEIAAVKQRVHIVDSLSADATLSKAEIQLTREALKREELDLKKRSQECRSAQIPARAFSANESDDSTPTSALPQVNALDPLEGGGSQFVDIQREVAKALRDILAKHCPTKWGQIRGGQPPSFFPLPFYALLCGSDHVAQSYMETGPNVQSLRDWFGKTIAHIAAQSGRILLVGAALLEANLVDFDRKDSFGLTPVMIAAIHAPLECLQLLIDANYTTHERDMRGRSLISIAARHGRRDVVEYLLDNGIDYPNDRYGVERCSPIYEAVESAIESQVLSTCLLLLTWGANPDIVVNGKTALTLANEASPDYIGLLLSRWPRPTQAGNNFDEYSAGLPTSGIGQPQAAAGPSGDSNSVHLISTMTAQAPNQTNQPVLQGYSAHAWDQFNSNEQYQPWAYNSQQQQQCNSFRLPLFSTEDTPGLGL